MATKRKSTAPDLDRQIENVGIWIHALEDHTDRMSLWEQNFLENVSDWFGDGGNLSPAQYETLEKLYRKFY